MARLEDLSIGDTVSWSIPKPPQEDSIVHGVISSLNREDETARIKVWAILENGSHSETDRTVEIEVSRLRKINDFRDEMKQVSARIEKILQDKVTEHNSKDPRYRATLRMLKACFRRGVGAYRNNPASVRGNVRSADQWALARVNGLLYALRTGKFKRTPYDTDLLPSNHPLSSKKNLATNTNDSLTDIDGIEHTEEQIDSYIFEDSVSDIRQFVFNTEIDIEEFVVSRNVDTGVSGSDKKGKYDDLDFSIPKGVKAQAEQGLRLRSEFGRGGTSVGLGTARYLVANTTASPDKVRHIAKYFPRHEVDLQTDDARDYLAGRTDRATNGVIAWKLWGGNAGQRWSNKLVRAMNKRDEVEKSASELVRRHKLREQADREYRTNRLTSTEVKQGVYRNYDAMLRNWELWYTDYYVGLLRSQLKKITRSMVRGKDNPAYKNFVLNGQSPILNNIIDETSLEWKLDLYDIYLSQVYDFNLFQFGILLPESLKGYSELEDTDLYTYKNRRKTRNQVINEGFYPIRLRGGDVIPSATSPIPRSRYNRKAVAFVNERLDSVMPDLAKTTKANLNRTIRRSIDEAVELGLSGDLMYDYITGQVENVLPKKLMGRASTIARTEGGALAQFGQYDAVESSGLITVKEWQTQFNNSRDTHITADGQVVGQNDNFRVGGEFAQYPKAPNLSAKETVNCRCNVIYREPRPDEIITPSI